MKKLIRALDRYLMPCLAFGYLALCVVLLAVSPGVGALLSMLWGVAMMAALRWGIWGILMLAKRQTRDKGALTVLTRTVEVMQILLFLGAVALAVLLWEIPAVWLLTPAALCGLRGAVRFDAAWL